MGGGGADVLDAKSHFEMWERAVRFGDENLDQELIKILDWCRVSPMTEIEMIVVTIVLQQKHLGVSEEIEKIAYALVTDGVTGSVAPFPARAKMLSEFINRLQSRHPDNALTDSELDTLTKSVTWYLDAVLEYSDGTGAAYTSQDVFRAMTLYTI